MIAATTAVKVAVHDLALDYTNPETGVQSTGRYGYYILEQFGTIGKVFSNNYSFWLQDQWEVTNRLTINAGVRTENEHVPSFKDQAAFPDALSIRRRPLDSVCVDAGRC